MLKSCCISILLFCFYSIVAQPFYIPYNLQQAYEKGTRSYTGKPGESYFQNKAKYTIVADFDPVKGILKGKEKVVYYNNSQDSLYYIIAHLYHNIFEKGSARDEEVDKRFLSNGVKISSLRINRQEYVGNEAVSVYKDKTNITLGLNYYVEPGDSVIINIEWETQLPNGHAHRFGNYGKGNWFVAYWYPQIAVFDDIDGWDESQYSGQYEFYNDFNDYEVEVSLPENYMVWATGDWINAEQILTKEVYNRYRTAATSDEVVMVVTEADWNRKAVMHKSKKNSFLYSAKNMTDFAFSVSNKYEWTAASTIVDSSSGRRTVIHTAYPVDADNFRGITALGQNAINHYSCSAIGIPYPYPNVTIFKGGGGMEFPMMVNQRNAEEFDNNFTAIHELFHAYFPFYTGINEKKYAWLDEGLTSYLAIETEAALNSEMKYPLHKTISYYNEMSGLDQESPLFTPSLQTRGMYYYHQAYSRSTVAFAMLEHYMGRKEFREAIRLFVDRWKGKHPTGYDFVFTLMDAADEDLSWLIRPWFFEPGWADLAIDTAVYTRDGLDVTIRNVGGLPVPIELKCIPNDSSSYFVRKKADVWKESNTIVMHLPNVKDLKRLELGNLNVPDKESLNNYFYFPE